jgi:hypothetical protein
MNRTIEANFFPEAAEPITFIVGDPLVDVAPAGLRFSGRRAGMMGEILFRSPAYDTLGNK